MKRILFTALISLFATQVFAQQKILKPEEFTDHMTTVGGELQITPQNTVELNEHHVFAFTIYEPEEHERGVFLVPHYSFGDTDVVLFWKCGTEAYSTGTLKVITVRRNGKATYSLESLGTGMFPVITRTPTSLKLFFAPSTGLHGGGSYPETWVWQSGRLTKVRTKRS